MFAKYAGSASLGRTQKEGSSRISRGKRVRSYAALLVAEANVGEKEK